MKIDLEKQDLNLLYNKAKEKYNVCIENKDNDFLKEEINVSLKTIELKRGNVKITFSQEITKSYLLEVSLALWDSSNNLIGKYVYIEDNKGNAVDDSLIFF